MSEFLFIFMLYHSPPPLQHIFHLLQRVTLRVPLVRPMGHLSLARTKTRTRRVLWGITAAVLVVAHVPVVALLEVFGLVASQHLPHLLFGEGRVLRVVPARKVGRSRV